MQTFCANVLCKYPKQVEEERVIWSAGEKDANEGQLCPTISLLIYKKSDYYPRYQWSFEIKISFFRSTVLQVQLASSYLFKLLGYIHYTRYCHCLPPIAQKVFVSHNGMSCSNCGTYATFEADEIESSICY